MFAGLLCIPLVTLCDIRLTLWFGDSLTRLKNKEDPSFLWRVFLLLLSVAAVQGVFRFPPSATDRRRLAARRGAGSSRALGRLSSPLSFHVQPFGRHREPLASDVENAAPLLSGRRSASRLVMVCRA